MEYKVYRDFEEMYQDLRHPKFISHPVVEEKKEEKPKTAKKSTKKKESK